MEKHEHIRIQVAGILASITDPEIPVLTLYDMGIIRAIHIETDDPITGTVTITPTYSGCPAMDMIEKLIRIELDLHGFSGITIESVLSPAWTTDWMSEDGKQKLKAYGIAPPTSVQSVCSSELFAAEENIQCPRCNSWHTERKSFFGSTACKALYQCHDCKEPFDYFKCH